MSNVDSITIIVPALNEERNITSTLMTLVSVLPEYFSQWEILVFNDGSTDRTFEKALAFAGCYPQVRLINHAVPHNLGGCYKEGIALATGYYVMLVPGDNECGESVLRSVFSSKGIANIIIPFTANQEVRPLGRQLLSNAFTFIMNILSTKKLSYYNGTVLHKTALVRSVSIKTNSFAYQAEVLVSLLRKGHSYIEIPICIDYRNNGKSKALSLRNIVATTKCLFSLATSH